MVSTGWVFYESVTHSDTLETDRVPPGEAYTCQARSVQRSNKVSSKVKQGQYKGQTKISMKVNQGKYKGQTRSVQRSNKVSTKVKQDQYKAYVT